ncbi:NADPH-dependent F420 reductase [Streptomyces sp. KL116D]|uniref:NADPH-dependent F420 reductase n=1 Tax=Streptomyces sp. KL116D TaxID=3045152 RepID=UPI003557E585
MSVKARQSTAAPLPTSGSASVQGDTQDDSHHRNHRLWSGRRLRRSPGCRRRLQRCAQQFTGIPESIAELVQELGPLARAATVDEAIAAGDIIALPVPLASFEALPADKLAGKVVLDQTDYYPEFWRSAELDAGELTSSELVQRHLKDSLVVKGLHNLDWNHMYSTPAGRATPSGRPCAIAGNDSRCQEGGDTVSGGGRLRRGRCRIARPELADRARDAHLLLAVRPCHPGRDHGNEEKRYYLEHPVPPVSPEAARTMIASAERPAPVGGTLAGMPPAHVAIFMDQASAGTVNK